MYCSTSGFHQTMLIYRDCNVRPGDPENKSWQIHFLIRMQSRKSVTFREFLLTVICFYSLLCSSLKILQLSNMTKWCMRSKSTTCGLLYVAQAGELRTLLSQTTNCQNSKGVSFNSSKTRHVHHLGWPHLDFPRTKAASSVASAAQSSVSNNLGLRPGWKHIITRQFRPTCIAAVVLTKIQH